MLIRLATDQDSAAWDFYVSNHPDGLAYHQFAWKRAIADAYGFSSRYLLAEKNGEILGVFPLIVFKRLFRSPTFISLPYCDVGGCLANTEEIKDKLIENAKDLAEKEGVAGIELRSSAKSTRSQGEAIYPSKVRMVLELPSSADEFLKGLKSKLRSQVKKPKRDGLLSCLGGAELVSDFYHVFNENMRDLGSPVHSLGWIRSVVENYAENARVGLIYTPDKKLAAAGIILLHGDVVSIPWASSLRRYNRLNPNMLLYWSFLEFAADNGYRYFDFGRSTPGEGTFRFKEQWGAKPQPLQWIRYSSMTDKPEIVLQGVPSRLRLFVAAVWQKLPLLLVNTLGPILRKRISL